MGPAGRAMRAGAPPGPGSTLGRGAQLAGGPLEQQQRRDWPGLPAGGLPWLCGLGAHGKGSDEEGDPAKAAQGCEAG